MYILHFNDVHGFVTDSGEAMGYPRLGGFIRQFREQHPDTLVLDAGDVFAGSALAAYGDGQGILDILNTLELDALSAGNADYCLGAELLGQRAAQATFPMLSANMRTKDGQAVLPGEVVLTLPGGLRVGIVGFSTPLSGRGELEALDVLSVAQAAIARLRPQVDVLVALTHLGDNERDAATSLRLARETSGFDVIIDGHSHTVLPQGRVENGVLIAQAGEYGRYVGVVELDLASRSPGCPPQATARLLDKADLAHIPPKAETQAALDALLADAAPYLNEVVGHTAVALDGTRNTVRVGETTAGNLVADAVRFRGGAEIGMVIAGTIGGSIPPGDLTREHLMTLARVNSDLVLLEARGADILACLESVTHSWPTPHGRFTQVSGLCFALAVEGGPKVRAVTVNGAPLAAERRYTVATHTFLSAGPGLNQAKVLGSIGDMYEALGAYFAAHDPITVAVEGRIRTLLA